MITANVDKKVEEVVALIVPASERKKRTRAPTREQKDRWNRQRKARQHVKNIICLEHELTPHELVAADIVGDIPSLIKVLRKLDRLRLKEAILIEEGVIEPPVLSEAEPAMLIEEIH